jgi:hypothetical protein
MKKSICISVILFVLIPLHAEKNELMSVLTDLDRNIGQLQIQSEIPVPDLAVTAESLGSLEKIFFYVRETIRFEAYRGKLRGPEGTFAGGAGNSFDQSELLARMLGMIGLECRFARGRLDKEQIGRLIAAKNPTPHEKDSIFGENPAPSMSRKTLPADVADHCWIQAKQGDKWIDLDPCFPDSILGQAPCRIMQSQKKLPSQFVHRVKLEVNYRISSGGKKITQAMLSKEFPVADLYGKPLTLVSLVGGTGRNDAFELEEAQPVLKLGDELFPGSIYTKTGLRKPEGGIAKKAAGRLEGIFDNLDSPPVKPKTESKSKTEAAFIIESKWVDVTFFSPGRPADRFRYTVFDAKSDTVDTESSVRFLETAVAFGFSSAPVTAETYRTQTRLLAEYSKDFPSAVKKMMEVSQNADSLLKDPLSEAVTEFNILSVEAERALAWMIVQTHMFHSDSALKKASQESGIAAYFGSPRAVIASCRYKEGKTIFDLDLHRNQCRFVSPSGRPGGWEKNLSFLRGLFESRLEGAVLKSFAGKVGLTAGDVLENAEEQKIPLRWITRFNRNKLQALDLDRETKTAINQALNNKRGVFLPERAVRIGDETKMAWYELDEETGFLDGVFSTGKHQSMVEKVQLHLIGCIVNSAKGYYFSMGGGFVFGVAAGLNHFLACALANPAASCFDSGEVCLPAIRDAKKMCQTWGFYGGAAQFNPLVFIGLPDLLTLTFGDPCEAGAAFGLAFFGCY